MRIESDRYPLTGPERKLLQHVSMWGSDGYPIQKLARGWTWGTSEVPGPPVVFKTKGEAVASFEAFLDVLRDALGQEAFRRAVDELRRQGLSEEDIQKQISRAHGANVEGYRETCWFCRAQWGSCRCKFTQADHFDFDDTTIEEPNLDVTGRFFVDPEIYYRRTFKRDRTLKPQYPIKAPALVPRICARPKCSHHALKITGLCAEHSISAARRVKKEKR